MTDFYPLIARNLILMVAALAAVYFIYSLLRLLRMGRKRRPVAAPIPSNVLATQVSEAKAGFLRKEPQLVLQAGPTAESSSRPTAEMSPVPAPDFAHELTRSTLEIEVQSLRREMHGVRTELAQLAAQVQQLKATQGVSPLYSEAMTMAQQGVTAAGISDRCGISLGEAELVAALAKGGYDSPFPFHEGKGEHDDRYINSEN
jgi:hypothetical protein